MVILGDDPLLEAVARRAGEAWTQALLPLDCARMNASLVYSKITFAKLSESAGLPVPQSKIGSSPDDARAAVAAFQFPLIFKEESGFSGSGVFKFDDLAALENYCKRRTLAQEWLMQAEIKGRVGTVDALFDHGVPTLWVCSYAVNTRNGPFGSSSVRQFFGFAEIQPLLESLGKATGVNGLVGVDFMHEQPNGRIVLLEMNCRPTAGHAIAEQDGIHFGAALCRQLRGEAAVKNTPLERLATIPLFPEDVDRVITDKDWPGIAKWIVFPSYWRCLPWSDPGLLARHIGDTCGRLRDWMLRTSGLKR